MSERRQVEQMGRFRVIPDSWRVIRTDRGAVGINILFLVLESWDPNDKSWDDWSSEEFLNEYGQYEVSGTWWLRKTSGELNHNAFEQVSGVLGWQGSFEEVAMTQPPQVRCQVSVSLDDYKGKQRWRADWLNDYDSNPDIGGGGGLSQNEAKSLDAEFGSLVKAAAAANQRKKPKGATPANAPKKPNTPVTPAAQSQPGPENGLVNRKIIAAVNAKMKRLIEENAPKEARVELMNEATELGLVLDENKEIFVDPNDDLPF